MRLGQLSKVFQGQERPAPVKKYVDKPKAPPRKVLVEKPVKHPLPPKTPIAAAPPESPAARPMPALRALVAPSTAAGQPAQDTRPKALTVDEAEDLAALQAETPILAIKFVKEVLSIPIDVADTKLLAIQLSAANTAINTQIKIDETKLKSMREDKIGKILEELRKEAGSKPLAQTAETVSRLLDLSPIPAADA